MELIYVFIFLGFCINMKKKLVQSRVEKRKSFTACVFSPRRTLIIPLDSAGSNKTCATLQVASLLSFFFGGVVKTLPICLYIFLGKHEKRFFITSFPSSDGFTEAHHPFLVS